MTNKSNNIKKGKFTAKELEIYKSDKNEIETILEFQKQLPILQESEGNMIDGRKLHKQLKVGRDYTNWIKEQLDELDANEGIEYSPLKAKTSKNGGRPKTEYFLTLDTAKEIAMIAGVKGGRTNPELKHLSKITRKYFIYIEKAFKNRQSWNRDRENTIIKCKELKHSLILYKRNLIHTVPEWFHGNQFIAEFSLLNEVIIGMSASQYRTLHNLNKSHPIRNTFSETQLEWVDELERYDADLIKVQEIFDYEKRKEILLKKFKSISQKAIS